MLLIPTTFRIRTVMLVLMIMLVQVASAGVPGYDNAKPVAKRFAAGFHNPCTVGWPSWLQTGDSLNNIFWTYFIDINPSYNSRDASIRIYQAYGSITFSEGFESALGDEFETQIFGGEEGDPDPTVNAGTDNRDMNWIVAKKFDDKGNVITEAKQFFDRGGRLLQSQTKANHRNAASQISTQVFATQPIRDAQGRDAAVTMAAPINNSEFSYSPNFVQNSNGTAYDYRNFDRFRLGDNETDKTNNPDAVGGQSVPGTLGWYYSLNNTWEPYTPTTNYPFTRQSYYRDGTGNIKKAAVAGETFKMGNGHEVSNYITPVVSELDHYLQVRNQFFPVTEMGSFQSTMANEAIQTVSIDANGKMGVLIQDKGGRTLFSARPGSDLVVNNAAKVKAGEVFYFRLFATGTVTLSSASNVFTNMETEQPISIGTGASIGAGYYKVVNTGTTLLTVNYSNGYTDVAYDYYNQLGQLVATVAPEGVKRLLNGGLNNYATKNDIPFIILKEYDVQGRLVKSTSTDGGACEMVYRTDGKIRFAQNAEQKTNGRFSYTNYDQSGRVIESGEYRPQTGGIQFNSDMAAASNPMRDILENSSSTGGLVNGDKIDALVTVYDVLDNSHGLTSGQNIYAQNEEFLGGLVSVTRKYSVINNNTPNNANLVSATWYNYNEEGKTLWTIQYINGLGYKTTDYTYDIYGRLIKKDFQKGATGTERFIHYYDYDPNTQNLSKVSTSLDDLTIIPQATYKYYLHGPLKRVELATNLQGIDYTYTLQGQLKAINNCFKSKDPGNDGSNGFNEDAFGMVLDYYPNDYQNTRTGGIQPVIGVNTAGIGSDSYVGKIKAMTWFSKKPASVSSIPKIEDPTTYVYQYDDKYQFTESTWGTDIGLTAPGSFVSTTINKEAVKDPVSGLSGYDANGNILYLQRTDGAGALKDNFTYNYISNTNQLQKVVHNASSAPEDYAKYTYNQLGQVVGEDNTFQGVNQSKYIEYDVAGKVVAVYRDIQKSVKVVEYVYDEMGDRVVKRSYSGGQLSFITYYVGSVTYTQQVTNGTLGAAIAQEYEIEGTGGRIGVYYRQIPVYAYELSDHQGNVRAVIAKSGNTTEVRMYTDYYPFGYAIRGNPQDYRYGYQGQFAEKDGETDWNAFELRMYDSRIARWLSVDPAGQYASPYVGMGNNPVNGVDKDGGFLGTLIGAVVGGLIEGTMSAASGKGFWDGAKRGAVRGAIAGAVFDAATTGGASLLVAGALSGGFGELADQAFFGDGKVHIDKLVISTVTGGMGGVVMNYITNRIVSSVTGKVYRTIIETPEVQSVGMGDNAPNEWMPVTGNVRSAEANVVTVSLNNLKNETFYRAMSTAEYEAFVANGGKLTYKPGTELFVSTEEAYASKAFKWDGYDVLVKLNMKQGAMDYFRTAGVKRADAGKGWAERGFFLWKREDGIYNLGIQSNTDRFNTWVEGYQVLKTK